MSASQPPSDSLPTEQVLLSLVEQLNHERRYPEAVQLTEVWAEESGPLPLAAGIAAARALLSLHLVDRAWARLREQTGAAHHPEILLLTAQAYIERGHPSRAGDLLARVRAQQPDHPALGTLEAQAAAPPLRLPANTPELERAGDASQLRFLAERHLAAGSLLRARGLLERLRRLRPADTQVQDLLWAARGEFRPAQLDLAAMVAALQRHMAEPEELTAEWESTEHTESMRETRGTAPPTLGRSLKAPAPNMGFPLLFRNGQEDGEPAEEAEVTIAAIMASREELQDPPTEEVTESGDLLDDEPDTRIMEVISSDRGGGREPRPSSEPAPTAATPDRRAVDLRALTLSDDPDTEQLDLEEAGERVVLTRLHPHPPPTAPAGPGSPTSRERPARRRPIGVVEKHPIPARPAEGGVGLSTSPAPPSPPPPPSSSVGAGVRSTSMPPPPPQVQREGAADVGEEPAARRPQRSGVGLLLLAVGLSGLVILVAVGIYLGMRAWAAVEVEGQVQDALSAGEFSALRELEVALTEQVRAGQPPQVARASALALVEAVLWSEFTGDVADRAQAVAAIARAREAGAGPEDVALAEAHLALVAGDSAAAAQLAALGGTQPEARYLQAQVALSQGAPIPPVWQSPPMGARYAALTHRLQGAEAGAVAKDAALELRVTALEMGWPGLAPGEQQRAVEALLEAEQRVLSPRQRGRLLATLATLHAEGGRDALALRAWQQALRADGSQPSVLAAVARGELASGAPLAALDHLTRCLDVRPVDVVCQRVQVMALLELDRVVSARAVVAGQPVLDAWVTLTEGDASAALSTLAPLLADPGQAEGLVLYVAGLARAEQGEVEAAESMLSAAQTRLAGGDGVEQRLAQRAQAVLLSAGTPAAAARRAEALRGLASTDPVVHLALGEYYARIRRTSESSQHLARAEALATQQARVLWALGRRQPGAAGVALWGRYLELSPEGARAEEARRGVDSALSVSGK